LSRKRVLYFTVVPLMDERNGGNLCCRNHIRRLAADPGIELFVAAAGHPEWEAGTRAFAASLGVWLQFDYFVGGTLHPVGTDLRSIASFAATMVLQTPWDIQAYNQQQIDRGLSHAIAALEIDVLVIDYTVSALNVRLPRTDAKTVLIKLGREEEFYRDKLTHGPTHHGKLTKAASIWRWGCIERRIDCSVDQVVVIGAPDLPRHKTKRPPVCITPTLDFRDVSWEYAGSDTAFFVGNLEHYPNRVGIEWIATKLAPEVGKARPSISFTIVGASVEEVPDGWRRNSIKYLGEADRQVVEKLFLSADVFLCPIENTFGVKFKAAEALSFGIPLLASEQTLLGLPYLSADPNLTLNDPVRAAHLICATVGNRERLIELSSDQRARQRKFAATQVDVWSRMLGSI
jgi:glycosyltransferase involved in cell wall biosynthesis